MADSETTSEIAPTEPETTTNKEEVDKQSVDLKSETASTNASADNQVIDLEKEPEPAENAAFIDEGEPKQPVQEEQTVQEGPPEEPTTSPVVEKKLSNDPTDQIQMSYSQEDNLSYQCPVNIFGQKRRELGPVVEISSDSSGEEEEEFSDLISYLADFGIKEEREPIDRAACEAEYAEAKEYNLCLRRRNGLLNKKISEYYYRRKIMRVFDDGNLEMYESMLAKYEQRIHDLYELKIKTNREREAVDNELRDMINLRDDQKDELAKSFHDMQRREADVMRGLIDSNTGKVISDKVIEKLLARQKAKSETISEIRLAYIKRRDKIKSLEQKIKTLETIGGTLHLMDFEQLRMENQTYSDKIEERDDELMRLRDRYSHAMQSNAHIREKINIIEVQIDDLQEKLYVEETHVNKARQRLNKLKIQRDIYRSTRDKLKINTGILTYPKLLMDMAEEQKAAEKIRQETDNLIAINKVNRTKLNNIRNTIEKAEHSQARKLSKKFKLPRKMTDKFHHSRPSLNYPNSPKKRSRITHE